MNRIIFTTYDDIEHIDDRWGGNVHQAEQINDYFNLLVQNKKDYAESIGAQFILFHNTMKDFNVDAGFDFAKVNLYKHYLMAQLAEDYDEVMYVDMDVLFNTELNVFEELNLEKGIHIKDQDDKIVNKNIKEIVFQSVGQRSPTIKYHITKDLLGGQDNHVMNTGIMIGKSEHIKQIHYYDRMMEAIKKLDEIKSDNLEREDGSHLRVYYYPNNESIFSYIMEKYNVLYVLMDKQWHYIISDPEEINLDDIKIAHFVNKKFNIFFEDKTKLIYSIYIEIPDERLDNPKGRSDDPVNKSMRTKQRLRNYEKELIENHKAYAASVGATYINFRRDEEYEEFFNRFPDLSEYDIINLYKVYLLDKLTDTADLVLYIDYDVVFNQNIDAFNFLKAESCFCCDVSSGEDSGVTPGIRGYFEKYEKDFRNPQAKYWNCHALLQEEDLDGDNKVFNTGIMMASKKVMDRLNYFDGIDNVLETMKELKEFSMYPPAIQKSFGYDNETIMSYKVQMNNVPVYPLSEAWHYKHDMHKIKTYDKNAIEFQQEKIKYNNALKEHNVIMTHFISKNFGLLF